MKIFQNLLLTLVFATLAFAGHAQNYDCEEELFSKKDKPTRLFGYVNAIGEYRVPPTFIKALPFVGKNAIVQQGKMFGVINCEGRLIVPADYELITGFNNGKGWVKKGGLWGLVDVKGKLLIQPLYEEIKEVNPVSGTVTWVKKSGLWGLISKENGRFVVPVKYEDVSNLSDSAGVGRLNGRQDLVYYGDGRVIIQNMREFRKLQGELFAYQHDDRKWGAVNSLAYILIRPRWDTLFLNSPLVQVKSDQGFGLFSLRGAEVVAPEYKSISQFVHGIAAVQKGEKWGLISTTSKPEAEGLVYDRARINTKEGTVVLTKSSLEGLWDIRFKKWLFPIEYQSIVHRNSWLLLKKNNKVRQYMLEAKRFAPVQYEVNEQPMEWDSVAPLSVGNGALVFNSGKGFWLPYGFPQKQSGPFSSIHETSLGYSIYSEGGKFGLLNEKGEKVGSAEFEEIVPLSKGSTLFTVKKNGRKGALGPEYKIEPVYEDLKPCSVKLFAAKEKGKWGVANPFDRKWIIEPKYDSIIGQIKGSTGELSLPLIAYRKGKGQLLDGFCHPLTDLVEGRWAFLGENRIGLTNEKGVQLYGLDGKRQGDLIFEEIAPFSEGNAPARVSGKWGFINLYGKMVIPAQYEDLMPFERGIGYAKQNGKWGVLRKNGSWLVKPVGTSVSVDADKKRKLVMP